MAHIGIKIRERREELGLTQQQLADLMGYKSKSTINKVELGINDIPQKTIAKYAESLQTTISYLMEWEEEPQPRYSKVDEAIVADFIFDPIKNKYIRQLYEVLGTITEEEGQELINYAKYIASKRVKE